MAWKLVETNDSEKDALTDSELIGIGIHLIQGCKTKEMLTDYNVYYRSWCKIQKYVNKAMENGDK